MEHIHKYPDDRNEAWASFSFQIENEDGTSMLAGADYFWFFTLLMLITAIVFIFVAKTYKEKTYIQ